MAVMFVLGDCIGCNHPFTFNAALVPSITINGTREPICATCVALVNPRRIANGLDPIVPHPNAYQAQEV